MRQVADLVQKQGPSLGCSNHTPERLDGPRECAPVDDVGDHGQNCVEYIALMFGPGTRLEPPPKEEPSYTVTFNSLTWMSM